MHLITHSALLRALGWALFNSLWQMGLLWLFYRLALTFFRKASPSARYGLALFFLVVGSVWTVTSFITAFFWPQTVLNGGSAYLTMARSVLGEMDEFLPYGSTIYLATLGFLFLRYVRQYSYSKRLRKGGLSKASGELRIFTESTARIMGIGKKVAIWLSSKTEIPLTLGHLKPVILLPFAMASNLTTTQVESLILHELAHIRRNDYLLNLFLLSLETLFFFNPFTRSLIRTMRTEREHSCDDLVMQFNYDPHKYVSALLSLANRSGNRPSLVIAATGENNQLLLQRARRILCEERAQRRPGSRPFIFLILTLAIGLISLSRFANPEKKPVRRLQISVVANKSVGSGRGRRIARTVTSTRVLSSVEESQPFSSVQEPASRLNPHTIAATHSMPEVPERNRDELTGEAGNEWTQNDGSDVDRAWTKANGTSTGTGSITGNAKAMEPDPITLATVISQDDRAYSIGTPSVGVTSPPAAESEVFKVQQPFVPNSSFSFQNIQDTTGPGEKLRYLQDLAGQDMQTYLVKTLRDLELQLKVYNSLPASTQIHYRVQKLALAEQIRFQREYIAKHQEMMKKLGKRSRHRVIVII